MKLLNKLGCLAIGMGVGAGAMKCYDMKINKKDDSGKKKFKSYYKILNQWLQLKQNSISLETWFTDNDYTTIAIYGFGELGKRLLEDLKDSNIKVEYVIDKSVEISDYDVKICNVEDDLEAVDVIVVTSVFDYENIEPMLKEKVSYNIVSLEDVVFEL